MARLNELFLFLNTDVCVRRRKQEIATDEGENQTVFFFHIQIFDIIDHSAGMSL